MVLFWGHRVTNPVGKTCFSQWYPAKFEVDGITYENAEQFMMACKARHFGDNKVLKEILKKSDPAEIKKLGRKVSNFDSEEWDSVCKDYVYQGNLAKFSQNEDLKQFLLSTGNQTIAEASPYDCIWGIGLSADDTRAQDPKKWLGTNYLGEVLMQVRNTLNKK